MSKNLRQLCEECFFFFFPCFNSFPVQSEFNGIVLQAFSSECQRAHPFFIISHLGVCVCVLGLCITPQSVMSFNTLCCHA